MASGSYAVLVGSLIVGILVGVIPMWLFWKSQLHLVEQKAAASATAQEKAFGERMAEKERFLREQLEEKDRSVQAQLAEKQKAVDEQKTLMENRLTAAFAALSGKTLNEVSGQFLKLANENFTNRQTEAKSELEKKEQAIEALLKPVQEGLKKLEKHCGELETKREVAYSTIEGLVNGLSTAAGKLSNALQRPMVRGSWGEMTLRAVVENAGLVERQDFIVQHSTDSDDGRLRADMVVRLPRQRSIALDSKTPLDAFREAVNCEDEAAREVAFKRYASLVREHMRALSEKQYWNQYEGLDYAIMFLPSEAMYLEAIRHDPALLDDARRARVLVANPATLIGLLTAVAYVLDQERLSESAAEISKIGRLMYDGVRTFGGHVARLGRNLEQSVKAYNDSVRSLERSVLPRAQQLKEKGVGGEAPTDLDEVDVMPIGFRRQELLAVALEEVDALPSDGIAVVKAVVGDEIAALPPRE